MKTILTSLLALTAVSGIIPAADSAPKPNIVFIISDDQGWQDYGFMGHPQIKTPNLDRLAAESLTFWRGYTPVPLCRPSLASMATGLYPHQHRISGNDPDLPEKGVNAQTARTNPKYAPLYQTIVANFAKQPNLVRDLTQRGYVSFQTGKWWEGDPIKTAGFSHAMTVGTGKGDRHGGAGLAIGRDGIGPIKEFVEGAGDKPFFVWYAPMLPHAPHTPPAELLEKYLKLAPNEPTARYWASVEWFDRSCGELLAYLEQKKLRENTIIIYTCDNGWIQNPKQANVPAPRSKLSPYEGGVRTPIMVSWPGKVKPRMDKDHLASNLDLWPTVAALLNTETPKNLPGLNLTDAEAVAKRTRIFGEDFTHNLADVNVPARSLRHRWVIDGWWKLIAPDPRNLPKAKSELYDLRTDPAEKNDLADKDPERVKDLARQLDEWWRPEPAPASP